MARVGLLADAERVMLMYQKKGQIPSILIPQGELALARGQTTEGISLLEEGLREVDYPGTSSSFFLASESLAEAYENQGELQKALRVLEKAAQEKAGTYQWTGPRGFYWIRIQWQLAQLYRKLGREHEAEVIETELLKLLAYADPDHPILLQLKQQQEVAANQRPH